MKTIHSTCTYMAVSGIPFATTSHHAEDITNFAFDIHNATQDIRAPSTGETLKVRIGEWLR